jgi:excisionase family DNA binding protein
MQDNNTNEMFADYPDVVDVSGLQSMLGGIGQQKAYELVRKGTIKAIKIGKLYRIPKINVITFLMKNTV